MSSHSQVQAPSSVPRILILGWLSYPFGSGGASRIRHIAKGLRLAGAHVQVITTRRLEKREEDRQTDGTLAFEGISYETTNSWQGNYRGNEFARGLALVRAIQRSMRRCEELINSGEINAVILYSRSFLHSQPFIHMCRRYGIPVLADAVEWYISLRFPYIIALDWLLGMHLSPRFLNGAIAISSFIERKYQNFGIPVIRIPALLETLPEPSNKANPAQGQNEHLNLVYVGQSKPDEAVEDLIEGLSIARRRGCPAELKIVGNDGRSGLAKRVKEKINASEEIRRHVHFSGRLSDDEYGRCLRSADALLIPRKMTMRALAAFPTRIPEFLATGNPLVTTAVPDVSDYLSDGLHAHVVPPGQPLMIAERIMDIYQFPERNRRMGLAGRERLMECFDYRKHTLNLFTFINSLQSTTH